MPEILPGFSYLPHFSYSSSSNLLHTYLTCLVFKPVATDIQKHSCGSRGCLHSMWNSSQRNEFSKELCKDTGLMPTETGLFG